jgi:hypothetical protein
MFKRLEYTYRLYREQIVGLQESALKFIQGWGKENQGQIPGEKGAGT